MAPVARVLASRHGVLEPIQTACSVAGQVEELRACLEAHGTPPLTLIGHSWGAWLCVMLAARHPELVRKLLLVSSGPFEERYVAELEQARRDRLSPAEREELFVLMGRLARSDAADKDRCLARLGELASRTDAFDPLPRTETDADGVEPQGELFRTVWNEAAAMRRDGRLLKLARRVHCSVLAIHGDHDPHPARGVLEPLSEAIPGLRFVLLSHCGHTPWEERQARERFYEVLAAEL
jgi:pimeloyl-ACP methyl ester carboxylesterase